MRTMKKNLRRGRTEKQTKEQRKESIARQRTLSGDCYTTRRCLSRNSRKESEKR